MKESTARATLTRHGWVEGSSTRGLPDAVRLAIKAALFALDVARTLRADEDAKARRLAERTARKAKRAERKQARKADDVKPRADRG